MLPPRPPVDTRAFLEVYPWIAEVHTVFTLTVVAESTRFEHRLRWFEGFELGLVNSHCFPDLVSL